MPIFARDKKHTVHGAKFYLSDAKSLFSLFSSMNAFHLTGAEKISGTLAQGEDFSFRFRDGLIEGNFLEVVDNKRIVMVWNVFGFNRNDERNTIVELDFSDENGMALLYLKHSCIPGKESKSRKVSEWKNFLEGLDAPLEALHRELTF